MDYKKKLRKIFEGQSTKGASTSPEFGTSSPSLGAANVESKGKKKNRPKYGSSSGI